MDLCVRADNTTTEAQSWLSLPSITDDSLLAVWWLICWAEQWGLYSDKSQSADCQPG